MTTVWQEFIQVGKIIVILFSVVFVLALIIFVPFIFVWALNTLFPVAIGYTWKTWLAGCILLGILNGGHAVSKSNK